MRPTSAPEDILRYHPPETYQHVASVRENCLRSKEGEAEKLGRPSQAQGWNPVCVRLIWRRDSKLSAKEMHLMPQISKALCGTIKVPLRSSAEIEPLMGQSDLHPTAKSIDA